MATSFPDVARARINILQDADDKHTADLRTAKNNLYNSAINDPNLDVLDPNDPDKDKKIATRNALIQERLQNMSPAEAHNAIGDLINTIHSHIANRNNPAPASSASPATPPPPPAVAGSNTPPPPPSGRSWTYWGSAGGILGKLFEPRRTSSTSTDLRGSDSSVSKAYPNHPLSTGAKDIDTLACLRPPRQAEIHGFPSPQVLPDSEYATS